MSLCLRRWRDQHQNIVDIILLILDINVFHYIWGEALQGPWRPAGHHNLNDVIVFCIVFDVLEGTWWPLQHCQYNGHIAFCSLYVRHWRIWLCLPLLYYVLHRFLQDQRSQSCLQQCRPLSGGDFIFIVVFLGSTSKNAAHGRLLQAAPQETF